MVAAVYRQLEGEGLLTRLRGSRTLLRGIMARVAPPHFLIFKS